MTPQKPQKRITMIPGVHSQTDMMLDHFIRVGALTPLVAHDLYGVNSFHRRIADLRAQGCKFDKVGKRDNRGRRYVEYSLAQAA
jgi:hypothetical protein